MESADAGGFMMKKQPVIYVSGAVQDKNVIRVLAQVSDPDGEFICSWILKWTRSQARWAKFQIPWIATQTVVAHRPELQILTTGPDGRVSVLTLRGNSEEQIEDGKTATHLFGYIRRLHVIDDVPYVCGMSRQVLRRQSPNVWVRQDQGVLGAVDSKVVSGFNAVDGVTADSLYAVGFAGEIWRRYADRWQQLPLVTNLLLNDVKVIRDDLVYVCGKKGILLRGHDETWEVLDQELDEEFWSMAWFNHELYVASTEGLYRLDSEDRLQKVSIPDCTTFGCMAESDGLLLSVGGADIALSEDGRHWIRVQGP